MTKPLFSVIVLCYRHFEYLYDAIDSVLNQSYPNIELIVSDDGSDNFPEEAVNEYIACNKSSNIKSVKIHREESNVGTVKHLNHAVKIISGEYVIALAGDDVLQDASVLEQYREGFEKAPLDCYIEMAQTGMYDDKLQSLEGYYLKLPVQEAIEQTEKDSSMLLDMLLEKGACLPSTSTCFKKEFFQLFGDFDEDYSLVEDFPMHFRLAKEHWIIHYENFVAIKHRNGGISHGQKDTLSRSAMLYYSDEKRMIESIILENNREDNQIKRENAKQWKRQLLWLDITLARSKHDYLSVITLCLKNPGYTMMVLLGKAYPFAYKWHSKLLYLCCALWLTTPSLAQILNTTMLFEISRVEYILSLATATLVGVWVYSFIVYWISRIVGMIQRFPNETLAIG